jgi:short subunit dehydrogenase-like uncharacterized protein
MADIVLFGATGFTGRLTAHALAARGASFAIAGRNMAKLEALAEATGAPTTHVAEVGDIDALVRALDGARVVISCVGPFVKLGRTAAEAALRAHCHYIDSTGEGQFIQQLISEFDNRARSVGIAMAPALGFDEVPSDVAGTLASREMEKAELVLTYALPRSASTGTLKSALGIMTGTGQWIGDGRPRTVRAGQESRWAPMPPPLGPRESIAAPLASGYVLPLHLDLEALKIYTTVGRPLRLASRFAWPLARLFRAVPFGEDLIDLAIDRLPEGPDDNARNARWTVLAEARQNERWRNVVLTGRDVYGLTAELLAGGALVMAREDYSASGVLAPVMAVGLDRLVDLLRDQGVTIQTYEPA